MNHSDKFSASHHLTAIINLSSANFDYGLLVSREIILVVLVEDSIFNLHLKYVAVLYKL